MCELIECSPKPCEEGPATATCWARFLALLRINLFNSHMHPVSQEWKRWGSSGWRKTFQFCFNNLWDHLVMLRNISVGFQDASFFGLETWSWGCPKLQSTLPCGGTPPTRGIIHFLLAPRRRICAHQKADVQKSVRIKDNGINTHLIYHFLKLRSDMLTTIS